MRQLRRLQVAAGASLVALGVAGAQTALDQKADAGQQARNGEAARGETQPGAREAVSFHHDHILGTSLDLFVLAPTDTAAEAAEQAALDEIERLRQVFSTFDPQSELSRLNQADGPVPASADLLAVLRWYDVWQARSGGALSARSGALIQAWKDAEQAGRVPSPEQLAEIVRQASAPGWELNEANGTVTRQTGPSLNLNAIAKGYILQRAAAAMREQVPAVRGLMLNLGGDLVVWGAPEAGGAGWLIDVQDPLCPAENAPPAAELEINDRAVATSGGYQRYYRVGGARHSHILDPRTGRPAGGLASATVVAADNVTANALATTLCVLPVEEGLRLVESTLGAECLLISADGRQARSSGLGAMERTVAVVAAEEKAAPAKGEAWPEGHQVSIAIELPEIMRGRRRYRRPYVAVWVENADGTLVRTISVWVGKPKWIKDLSDWWRASNKGRGRAKGTTRATRGPGKYEVVWDGKDDKGRPVPRGTYTVRVEVHREHGRHVRQSGKLLCGAEAAKLTLMKNAETEATMVEYGKKK